MKRILETTFSGVYITIASLFVAIVYGVIFKLNYVQPIDPELCFVFYMLALVTCFVAFGLFKLVGGRYSRGEDK